MRLDRVDVANLRAAGLTVVELPGWLDRGRPGSHDPKGILCHHTAADEDTKPGEEDSKAYAVWMAQVGRADLPAPLAQIGLSRAGVVYMQAAGRANHAGRCKPIRSWLNTYPGRDYGDGNAQLIGIEAMNTGTEGWGEVQKDAYVTLCAVLARRRDWDEQHVLGHKETSLEGKPDPSFDMTTHRAQVARELTGATTKEVGLAAEDADKVIEKLTSQINKVLLKGYTEGGVAKPSILKVLTETQRRVTVQATDNAAFRAEVRGSLKAIAAGRGLTDAELAAVRDAAQAGAEAGVESLLEGDVSVDVSLAPKAK